MKKITLTLLSSLLIVTSSFGTESTLNSKEVKKTIAPKLVLQITVDGLRGDLPFLYADRYGKGGFDYLLKEGVWYNNAHHPHSNTETILGHSNLATGAPPAHHGMVGNMWYDRSTSRLVYNIEDANYPLLGTDDDGQDEIDHTQVSKTEGRSPLTLLSSTLSDEIAIASNGKAKVFSVSGKDRAAVSLGGHAGKAFWYSGTSGDFITSTFYYQKYPEWVAQWNKQKLADSYQGKQWTLLHDAKSYVMAERDDREYETKLPIYGNTFPHLFGKSPASDAKNGKYYYTFLMASPMGDKLTLDFAKQVIKEEGLGKDDVTDYLSISLSATDYVNHLFGPYSLEQEDNLLQLDLGLADLFSTIDKSIGLENTLIVLSADHGAPALPGYSKEFGIDAGKIYLSDIQKAIKTALTEKYPNGEKLLLQYFHPYVYLNHEEIKQRKLTDSEVENTLVDALMKVDGISFAISSSDLVAGKIAMSRVNQQVLNNYHPKRSGDVYVGWQQHWSPIEDIEAANHSSPWSYDTHVPVVFAGFGMKGEMRTRRVSPLDIAPTITNLLKIRQPSGATGTPLKEVLKTNNNTIKVNYENTNIKQ